VSSEEEKWYLSYLPKYSKVIKMVEFICKTKNKKETQSSASKAVHFRVAEGMGKEGEKKKMFTSREK
jgi:hypothetical protein